MKIVPLFSRRSKYLHLQNRMQFNLMRAAAPGGGRNFKNFENRTHFHNLHSNTIFEVRGQARNF